MPNPIYLLHLSDWHLSQKKIDRLNKESGSGFDTLLQKITTTLLEFLKVNDRNCFDLIAITGDMMDKNGSKETTGSKDHSLAANILNNLFLQEIDKVSIRGNKTKVYCAPGNHDLN
ncbi:MAG: hypothetical protein HKN48_06820, partial [Flavobacteriaceae bacterium]|nr:hypothetical protein [Flavobacteriaceae bacterium]